MSVSVDVSTTAVTLTAPYDPSLPGKAKALGGYFDGVTKAWTFDVRDETRVRDLAREIYGTDGTVYADEPTVTVRIDLDALVRECCEPELRLAGISLARRPARDSAVHLCEGVVVVSGSFPGRGGSVKNPALEPADGTVLEVRDLPPAVAVKMMTEAATAHRCPVTMLEDAALDRAVLTEERERLVARLVEIDAMLG